LLVSIYAPLARAKGMRMPPRIATRLKWVMANFEERRKT
jgi:hypothetical protein